MAARIPMTKRVRPAIMIAVLAVILASCEENPDAARVAELLYQQISALGGGGSVPRERVIAIPYATLGVELGSSGEAMFVLASKSGDDLNWVGGSQFAVTTRHGRIVRTSGFAENLIGYQQESSAAAPAENGVHDYVYDLGKLDAYNVMVRCIEHDVGVEQVIVLGDGRDTRHIVEDCTAAQLDWSFRNEFWRDVRTGYIWKSLQYVHPGLDPLTLESLRPAAE